MRRMSTQISIAKAIKLVGLVKLAGALKRPNGKTLSYQAIKKWEKADQMPHSEYSGATDYASQIQIITNGEVTIKDILGTVPPHQAEKLKAA